MSEVVTTAGHFELTEFEQEHAKEVQDIAAFIPDSYGFIKRIVTSYPHLKYDRIQWLISQSPMLQTYLGIEINKRLDEAEGVIADVLEGTKVTEQRLKTAKWYLDKMGRSRGYTDGKNSQQVGSVAIEKFQINFVGPTDADKALLVEQQGPGRPKRTGTGQAPEVEFVEVKPGPPELF